VAALPHGPDPRIGRTLAELERLSGGVSTDHHDNDEAQAFGPRHTALRSFAEALAYLGDRAGVGVAMRSAAIFLPAAAVRWW